MNKTIIININSIVFHIEEDAYDTLRSYMIEIKRHFGSSEDSREILEDIENRIAEMFSEKIEKGKKEVISAADVEEVVAQMGRVNDFEEPSVPHGDFFEEEETIIDADYGNSRKLMRDMDDKVFGGVCSGLGHFFGTESKWVRILFVLFVMLGGSGILLYVILWIVMPKALTRADKMAMRGEQANLQNFKKSYEEELRDGFSTTREYVNRTASSTGEVFGRFFSVFGKAIAILIIVVLGLTIFGLIIGMITLGLGVLGLTDTMIPPLKLLTSAEAPLALLSGFLAIVIPFIALFYLFIRIAFKQNPMNHYLSLAMFSIWLMSIVGVIYYSVSVQQDFREKSTIKVEKELVAHDVYYFDEKDVRVIEAKTDVDKKSKFSMEIDRQNLRDFLRANIGIRFESLDSLTTPYIQYSYSANGKTYQKAADRASKIDYQAVQEGSKIHFSSHFSLQPEELERNQRVVASVFLPMGAKVIIASSLRYKLQDVSYSACQRESEEGRRAKYTEWEMGANGLVCLGELQEPDATKTGEVSST